MRQSGLLLILILLTALIGCTQHEDWVGDFPLPVLGQAQLHGANADSVHLTWTATDPGGVEQYMVYVGLHVDLGFATWDSLALADSTTATEFQYHDTALPAIDEDLCESVGMCDSLYKYTYFRISAVRGGAEGAAGPRRFVASPTP